MNKGERWVDVGRMGVFPNSHRVIEARYTDEQGNRHFRHVCQVEELHKTEEARQETARRAALIAAAPELMESLNDLLIALERDGMTGSRQGKTSEQIRRSTDLVDRLRKKGV